MSDRKLFDKRELLLIIPLMAAAAAIYILSGLFSPEGKYAVIKVDGTTTHRVAMASLQEPETLTLEGEHRLVIEIGPDYAAVISSDCPDQTCVRTGKITKSGQSAICLPAKVAVSLEGGEGFDGETY